MIPVVTAIIAALVSILSILMQKRLERDISESQQNQKRSYDLELQHIKALLDDAAFRNETRYAKAFEKQFMVAAELHAQIVELRRLGYRALASHAASDFSAVEDLCWSAHKILESNEIYFPRSLEQRIQQALGELWTNSGGMGTDSNIGGAAKSRAPEDYERMYKFMNSLNGVTVKVVDYIRGLIGVEDEETG
jgi:hypothetical protein